MPGSVVADRVLGDGAHARAGDGLAGQVVSGRREERRRVLVKLHLHHGRTLSRPPCAITRFPTPQAADERSAETDSGAQRPHN